jgi:hypothetical protein
LGEEINIEQQFPDNQVCIAALSRQLRRAQDAGDEVAAWLMTNALCSRLCSLLGDLLTREPSWDSEGRWLDALFRRRVVFESPERLRVTGPLVWGLSSDTAGPQWAGPFDAVLQFSDGLRELEAYTIRFGERNKPVSEVLREDIDRIMERLAAGAVAWSYEFRLGSVPG